MAKRGQTRRGRATEDDEFAWQTPETDKKKKKKKKSKKGRESGKSSTRGSEKGKSVGKAVGSKTKSSKSKTSSARSKSSSAKSKSTSSSSRTKRKTGSGKGTSARKSASARRRRDSEDDDDDLGDSGRRRRAPAPKKKGIDPVIPISIVTISLLLFVGALVMGNKKPAKQKDENVEWTAALEKKKEGMQAFREFNKYNRDGPPDMAVKKNKEALALLTEAVDMMNAVLDPKRDPESGMLPKSLEGYEKDLSEISRILIDLQKSGKLR